MLNYQRVTPRSTIQLGFTIQRVVFLGQKNADPYLVWADASCWWLVIEEDPGKKELSMEPKKAMSQWREYPPFPCREYLFTNHWVVTYQHMTLPGIDTCNSAEMALRFRSTSRYRLKDVGKQTNRTRMKQPSYLDGRGLTTSCGNQGQPQSSLSNRMRGATFLACWMTMSNNAELGWRTIYRSPPNFDTESHAQ